MTYTDLATQKSERNAEAIAERRISYIILSLCPLTVFTRSRYDAGPLSRVRCALIGHLCCMELACDLLCQYHLIWHIIARSIIPRSTIALRCDNIAENIYKDLIHARARLVYELNQPLRKYFDKRSEILKYIRLCIVWVNWTGWLDFDLHLFLHHGSSVRLRHLKHCLQNVADDIRPYTSSSY